MKCPNCGANLSNDAKFCTNCGNNIGNNNKKTHKSSNSSGTSGIINTLLSKPKLILVILIVIIIAGAVLSGFGNSSGSNYSNGGYDMEIFNLAFHIPGGFEESYHTGPFSSGETVDFKSNDYDDLEISVSPQRSLNLNSNHIKTKYTTTIDGREGTLVFYDSNRVSFYYYEGNYLVKLNTNSPQYKDLFAAVIK